jgi:polar amino acid transport system substrate-binding protein
LSGFEIGTRLFTVVVSPRVRRVAAVIVVGLAAALAATTASGQKHAVASSCASDVIHSGTLTVGTDNPAYPPWYGGNQGHGWKVSDPYSGKGYESAVAYAIAGQLGYGKPKVKWVYVPFLKSFAPGRKNFDFDINQISFLPERAKAATFSVSYYDVKQAIAVKNGTRIARVKTVAALKPFTLGAQLGTTSYQFIKSRIKPAGIKVYNTNALAVEALKTGRIDGLVLDLPTALYVTAAQVPDSKVLGQFASTTGEHFGVVLQKGNPFVGCVNKAVAALRANGTLARLEKTWITNTGVPVLK